MLRIALILGLLSAVGPFAIDLYLPALPAIETDLGTTIAAVQQTLTAYFIAFGVSQVVYGPLADQVGRKPPVYVGLAIFFAGSVMAATAPTIEWLTAARFVQGIGGAALMVVPRAIIRDLYTGAEATRLMATVMLVISVSPMLAPLAGAGLLAIWDWRGIFWVLAVAAMVSFAVLRFAQEETLATEDRVPVRLRSLGAGAKVLLRDPVFMGLTFVGGFGMASFFVFIASAAFVYTEAFGMSPTGFALAFAFNAIGFFGASQLAGPAGARFGMIWVMTRAVAVFALATSALFALAFVGLATLPVVMGLLFVGNAGLGFVIPATMVMALDPHGRIAGLASSLGGTLQMLTGGFMIAVSAPFFDGSVVPMTAAIALCGLGAFGLALITLPKVIEERASGTVQGEG